MQGNAKGRDLLVQAAQERWELFSSEQLAAVMTFLSDYGDDPKGHHEVCAKLINAMPRLSIRVQVHEALRVSASRDRKRYEQIEGAKQDADVAARARQYYAGQDNR